MGAPFDVTVNGHDSGSAYLFDASTGDQLYKLLPNDDSFDDFFGQSIAIDNSIVVIGAPSKYDFDSRVTSGAAYVFDANSGTQLYKLLSTDRDNGDKFGKSIAVDNGVVAVGAYLDDDNGEDSGSVYLFDAATGEQLIKLLPNDGEAGDYFGWSVAIDDGVVAVGAYKADTSFHRKGAAYLFDASTGVQLAKLVANELDSGKSFGWSIDLDNGIVAVGYRNDDDNDFRSGSAYLFNAYTGDHIAKLIPSDGERDDYFGMSISIDNGIVAVGTWLDDDRGDNSGSAYVFSVPCFADYTDDGVLNFFDVSVFLTFFQFDDPRADFTNDGIFDFFDVSAFLDAFAEGCP